MCPIKNNLILRSLLFALFCCTFSCTVFAQSTNRNNRIASEVVDSLFDIAARNYYAKHLKGQDIRDLSVSADGFKTITFGGKSHRCYNVLVSYSIYQNKEWFQTHYKNWYWDLQERKCYWYSDYSQKRKPGEPYRGMMTSVSYIDFTKESFAQKGFQILKRLQNE